MSVPYLTRVTTGAETITCLAGALQDHFLFGSLEKEAQDLIIKVRPLPLLPRPRTGASRHHCLELQEPSRA